MEKLLFNLHTHSHYCDGSAPPEAYIREALIQGFHTLGFSSHAPMPFENNFSVKDEHALQEYALEIDDLKKKYKNQINIFRSLEIDYIPGIIADFDHFREMVRLDYTIGGVHLVRNPENEDLWFIDGPRQEIYDRGLTQIFDDDIRQAVTTYWQQMREMVNTQQPDVVAHLDKIKMHNKNRFFTEQENWYEKQLDQTLDAIAKNGCIVEVNTRGRYKGRSDEFFPGKFALRKIHQMGIPVTLSSDTHKPPELSKYFDQARKLLREIGFGHLMIFTQAGWSETPV